MILYNWGELQMKNSIIIGIALLGIVVCSAPASADPAPAAPCDRACLTAFSDIYMDALTARNPAMAPFSSDARFTENGVALALGDALWATFDKVGGHRLIFADEDRQGVVIFTPIVENGMPAMLAARLKIRQHEIAELETMVTRKRDGFFTPDNFAVDRPYWSKEAGKSKRLGRTELIKIVDSYFNGIVEGRGDITPFDDDCWRYENGVAAVRNPEIETESDIRRMGCKEQFETGMLIIVTSITNRRYIVVDEERQIVVAAVTFNHRGNVLEVERKDGGGVFVAPPSLKKPYSLMVMEAFKMENGKIKQIEAILQNVPYKMSLGWPLDAN